ncbi:ribbon-helix-helix domain-containing protein [Cellulosimicrobium funkei]|uniref:ribbon-helix-helix domain-containing protein n=1 Tax=Cellulosimicrobium funkei TaxID=264251 RepID=UPI0030F6BF71
MSEEHRTIHGEPVPDEQIQAWSDEAEAGYDLPALRKRRRGRPAAGDGPGKPVTVRLDEQTLTALRERAKQEGLANESEAIRAAVRAWAHVV